MKLVKEAIAQLTSERDKLDLAIKALGHLNSFADANLGNDEKPVHCGKRGKRNLSPAARARIAAAQRARWARFHKEHGGKRA